MHRMTNDGHVWMYADGEDEALLAMAEFCVIPRGATLADEKEVQDNYFAHNQAVEKLLEEKGFVAHRPHPSRSVPMPVRLRRSSGKVAKRASLRLSCLATIKWVDWPPSDLECSRRARKRSQR